MMNITPTEMMQRPYEHVLIPEAEGGYSAYISEFEGCLAEGETPEEALQNLEETAIAWIEAEIEAGRDIPDAWNDQKYSGKLLLRFPKSLHRQLARQAEKEGVSLNQYVVYRLMQPKEENKAVATMTNTMNRILEAFQSPNVSPPNLTPWLTPLEQTIKDRTIQSGFPQTVDIVRFVGRASTTGQFTALAAGSSERRAMRRHK